VKIRPNTLFILIMSFTILSCTPKSLAKDFNRLIVGEWKLITMVKGTSEVKTKTETIFHFTADRQLIIKNNDKTQKVSYFIVEDILNVDDGVITEIREELKIEKLDQNTFVISFEMDGQKSKMIFEKKN
jgi:hypothetical protein